MNKAKMFLSISIGISIVICSIALLIFSCKDNTAKAQVFDSNEYAVVGVVLDVKDVRVIGYNNKKGVKILGSLQIHN